MPNKDEIDELRELLKIKKNTENTKSILPVRLTDTAFLTNDELEFFGVKDLSVEQTLIGSMFNFGSIKIHSTDITAPCIKIDMKRPKEWREKIRELVKKVKVDKGVKYEEKLN